MVFAALVCFLVHIDFISVFISFPSLFLYHKHLCPRSVGGAMQIFVE